MPRELTGRHVLAITLGAFGTIIAVNLFMAVKAVGTFPGLEVKNSYVASQSFDRDRAAQQALDWTVTPEYDGAELVLTIRDSQGNPAPVRDLHVTVGRPTHQRQDQEPEMTYRNGAYHAPLRLEPGLWNLHLTARAPDGTVFRQRIDHYHGNRVK
ncbi:MULTISPECIES: FixH family protein [unclassified Paracoccus (in: a-proteobacteria)]|uniref:FixH family protein n=1 Tax=unclassified Paracoccus (in: a-proteobacteria) TaxID=2688777 RepID=UPI0012B2F662|nr:MULTISPECIES: FixH family protein [unclassified Paracoccus (in: a-proteobacteria)]UXU76377.1 FixH family protein [Paracoccus sp. SMMA_5]UXU82285.1 FixH family protein [Paracoccus sp. SMMA_5_TC]